MSTTPAAAAADLTAGHAAERPVRFVHRGRAVSVSGLPATTSVLTWLREHAHCTGTKEGCNEGDCGACTVLVGELDAAGSVQFKPVNSCIQFLPTLDGKALLTVEDLGGRHPAQQAMVDCHGAQCGFCTPGFVVSLAALYQRHHSAMAVPGPVPSRQQIADDLSGNLCRCTGYRPILDAGEQMFSGPARPIETAPLAATLAATLAALQADTADTPYWCYAGAPLFLTPRTLDDLATCLAERPQARLLAGCTDIGLWVNKQFKDLGGIIYLGDVAALKAITVADGALCIGAGASLEAAWAALAQHWPALRDMGLRFASRPVREAGTLGGNLANGSPIGDSAPVLMALGARLQLRHGRSERWLPLHQFYTGYMRNALVPGEFVQAIAVPLPQPGEVVRAYKLSKRWDCDISALACGLWLTLNGDHVAEARFSFGGLAATVQRAVHAEAAVRGQPWSEATLRAAQDALDADYQPLSDLRASASYRRRAARALLRRLWLETRPVAPLAPTATAVWSSV